MENSKQLVKNDQYKLYGYQFKESEFKIIQAVESQSIAATPQDQLEKEVLKALQFALIRIGQKLKTDEEILFLTNDLVKYLRSNYSNIRVNELTLAIEKGSFGDFGEDVVYLSSKNVITWVKKYKEEKHEVFKTLLIEKAKDEQRQREQKEEKNLAEFWHNFPIFAGQCFAIYQLKGYLDNMSTLLPRYFIKIGYTEFLDRIPNEEKEQQYNKVKAAIIQRQKTEAARDFIKYREKDNDAEIKRICREAALEDWFKSIDSINEDEIRKKVNIYLENRN